MSSSFLAKYVSKLIMAMLMSISPNRSRFGINSPTSSLSQLSRYQSYYSTEPYSLLEKFRITTNIVAAIVLLWTIAFFFASLFQALPISKNWYPDKPGHMIDEFSMYLALACTELVLDVLILTLPWTMVWRLQIDSARKWIICGIFTLGGL